MSDQHPQTDKPQPFDEWYARFTDGKPLACQDSSCESLMRAAWNAALLTTSLPSAERCKHGVRWPHECSDCEEELRGRLEALRSHEGGIPEGWKLVPIIPTVKMVEALADNWLSHVYTIEASKIAYHKMIAAAPTKATPYRVKGDYAVKPEAYGAVALADYRFVPAPPPPKLPRGERG